jgi:hypothetical protein
VPCIVTVVSGRRARLQQDKHQDRQCASHDMGHRDLPMDA